MIRPALSIVMAYYERSALLGNTLASFKALGYGEDVEVVVVDDGSVREPLDLDPSDFPFKLVCLSIPIAAKRHINPCVPFNAGFAKARGSVILIQNPECIHFGDVAGHAVRNCDEASYLSYACYSLDEETTRAITENGWAAEKKRIAPQSRPAGADGQAGWYNHSRLKPSAYHFCSAITRRNLERLGGFDSRFAHGIGFDDDEFLYRVCSLPLGVRIVDEPSVLHQYHYSRRVYDKWLERKMHANWVLFEFYTKHGRSRIRYAYYLVYMAFYSRGMNRVAKLLRRLYPGFSSSLHP